MRSGFLDAYADNLSTWGAAFLLYLVLSEVDRLLHAPAVRDAMARASLGVRKGSRP